MWRGGGRFGLSVAAPFVWRCPCNRAVTPFPHPAHRTGHADLPHPALGQNITPARVTPSAVSERLSEFDRLPNLLSLTTCCVSPELRPLPSIGVTRLQRYYEPLRHPKAPGLSLAGVRLLGRPSTPRGFPCCVRFPLCTCCRHYPGAAAGILSALSPSRISLPRLESRVDLRIDLFEACSAFTRVTACTLAPSPYFVTVSPKASTVSLPPQLLRLHPAGAFRRVGFSPTGKRRLVTAHLQSSHWRLALGYATEIQDQGEKIKPTKLAGTNESMKTRIILVACVLAILNNGCVSTPQNDAASTPAQKTTFSGTAQPVWYFYAVHPDCTSAGLPTVEVTMAASHGSVVVQNAEHFTEYPSTNQRYECNKQKSPSVAVVYTSEKNFVGIDRFTVKCIFPSGNTTTKEFVISVEKTQSASFQQSLAMPNAQNEMRPNPVLSYTPPRMDPAHPLKIGTDYYPPESVRAKEQGRCIVAVTVTADGWLKDARIQQSTGYPRLDQACLDAVAGGHLIPATENGVPIEKAIDLPLVWILT